MQRKFPFEKLQDMLDKQRVERNGQWTSVGLGGGASGLALPTVNLHSDAAFSTTKGTYVLTGYNHGPGRGVWIAISRDGLTWSQGEWLQHSEDPNNQTLSPYITIVNQDGTDNALVGDSFYAYWAFAPRYTELGNGNLRYLVRQRVQLIAPLPPQPNPSLRHALQNARGANMPKDKIESAIRRASGQEQQDYEIVLYEGYAPHGVAVMVETATDNVVRTFGGGREVIHSRRSR